LTENVIDDFRIFTEPINGDTNLAAPDPNAPTTHQPIAVYTDGSCSKTEQGQIQAGSGVWFGVDDPRNKAYRVPGHLQTNQIAELYAGLQVIKNTPSNVPLLIKTDSKYLLESMTKNSQKWEDKGWLGITNYCMD
jgi:ribonuclease HI